MTSKTRLLKEAQEAIDEALLVAETSVLLCQQAFLALPPFLPPADKTATALDWTAVDNCPVLMQDAAWREFLEILQKMMHHNALAQEMTNLYGCQRLERATASRVGDPEVGDSVAASSSLSGCAAFVRISENDAAASSGVRGARSPESSWVSRDETSQTPFSTGSEESSGESLLTYVRRQVANLRFRPVSRLPSKPRVPVPRLHLEDVHRGADETQSSKT